MRGFALPSWVVAACAGAVAVALVAFVVTGERDADVAAAPSEPSASADAPSDESAGHDHHGNGGDKGNGSDKPAGTTGKGDKHDGKADKGKADKGKADKKNQPVERRTAYVEVYNNSGISGLAGDTAATLQDSGWRVVATDNWYGEIPGSTVYYPSQLEAQAKLLARDVGISRLHPAVAPMSFDRLTVILVGYP